MAFGDLLGTKTLTGASIGASNAATTGTDFSVAVGDLMIAVGSEQTSNTWNACSDNLGNTYAAINAGTLSTVGVRAYWSRVTTAGTITTVTITATSSAHDFAIVASGFAGPFANVGTIDANPANTTDATTPFDCPPTGTLNRHLELVIAAMGIGGNQTLAATSPSVISGTANRANTSAAISRLPVTSTSTVTPQFTGTTAASVQITASYKQSLAIVAESGSYALSGTNVSLEFGREIVVDVGSYALSGQNVTLTHNTVAAAPSVVQVSALGFVRQDRHAPSVIFNPPRILVERTIGIESGSYSLSGIDVSLERGYEVVPESGAYALAGTDVSLEYGREIAPDTGSYSLSGTAVSISHGYPLNVGGGTYTLSGQDVSLEYGREIAVGAGSYALSGSNVTFTWSGGGAPAGVTEFQIGSCWFSLPDKRIPRMSLSVVIQINEYSISAQNGSYTLNGQAVSIERGYEIVIGSGSYALNGFDVVLTKGGRLITVESGAYTLSGTDTSLEYGREIVPDSGNYALAGQDVSLEYGRHISIISGVYSLGGVDVDFIVTGDKTIIAESGTYLLAGNDVSLNVVHLAPIKVGGGPALGGRARRKKKRLEEILSELAPVVRQIKQDASKQKVAASATRAIQRARTRERLDVFADHLDQILSQRRDYERDVVLAAIMAQRAMRMEEEEMAAMILLAA